MRDSDEQVVLVDRQGVDIGLMDKLEAHRKGLLHRAISVFVFDDRGRVLLQRRALGKYHCPGLWANSCCSHPRKDEATAVAARRRLREELGVDCDLHFVGQVLYRADVGNGLIEHELVSAYAGHVEGDDAALRVATMAPDPDEVMDVRFLSPDDLQAEIAHTPEAFAPWLRIYVGEYFDMLFRLAAA